MPCRKGQKSWVHSKTKKELAEISCRRLRSRAANRDHREAVKAAEAEAARVKFADSHDDDEPEHDEKVVAVTTKFLRLLHLEALRNVHDERHQSSKAI